MFKYQVLVILYVKSCEDRHDTCHEHEGKFMNVYGCCHCHQLTLTPINNDITDQMTLLHVLDRCCHGNDSVVSVLCTPPLNTVSHCYNLSGLSQASMSH